MSAPESAGPLPSVSVVMLAWGDEPVLVEAVEAVLASVEVDVDVVLVDNGCTSDAVERLRERSGVTVIEPGENTGFAGGCNLGAAHARGDFVAFVNGDAVVLPEALAHLVDVAAEPEVGLASASLRLYDQPEVINSVGNPVHYSGLSWAGGLGEPAGKYSRPREIASATGAAVVARAERFQRLGGFCEPMFAYCEDAELSLRCWQHGWSVLYVPDAVVLHRYEFSRNDNKMYLLERNRLLLVLTLFEARTLRVLAPALLGLELAMLAVALKQGWARRKVAGWWWLLRHRDVVRERRAYVQTTRTVPDARLLHRLTGDFAPGESTGMAAPGAVRAGSRAYWSLARRLLRR